MKRILLLICSCFLFLSCNEKTQEHNKESYKKIDNLLNITFKDSFPNYLNNDLEFNNAYKFLESKKDSVIENKVLDDFPLEIFKIFKNKQGEGAIIHFVKHPNNKHYDFYSKRDTILSDFITYDLLAVTSEREAKKLIEGQKFYIKSKTPYIDINAIVDLFTNQTYYNNDFEINYSMRKLNINYGILFTEIDSLIPINALTKTN